MKVINRIEKYLVTYNVTLPCEGRIGERSLNLGMKNCY